jgi:ribosome maturation factor RimP
MARLADEVVVKLVRLAASEGVELLAVEYGGTARRPVVRLILDRQEGGVSLADCELVSRQASVLLDAYDPFPDAFTLEVSSPGLDRKLCGDKDYTRFAGHRVRVRMRPSWPAPRVIDGALVGREGGVVRVTNDRGVTLELPESALFEIRLAPSADEIKKDFQQRGREHR